jgi:hypothetical protein
MMDNTKPPFSIAAGTRITVYSPTDLIVAWCDGNKCGPGDITPDSSYAVAKKQVFGQDITIGRGSPETLIGQVAAYMDGTGEKIKDARMDTLMKGFKQYQSKSLAASDAYNKQLEDVGGIIKSDGSGVINKTNNVQEYNEQVLGMKYKTDSDGNKTYLENPNDKFSKPKSEPLVDDAITCDGGTSPDENGCCPGENFDSSVTSEDAPNGSCCPDGGGDCFPPIR